MLWTESQRAKITRHSYDLAPRYLEWKAIRVKDIMLPTRNDYIQLANPLPERMPTEIEILKWELDVEKKRNIALDH